VINDNTMILSTSSSSLAVAGAVANRYAARSLFADYRARKAFNTLIRHDGALALFAEFLAAAGVPGMPSAEQLAHDPAVWHGVTWGLAAKFVEWLMARGYALSTVNGSLSIIKTYCGLAAQAGAIPTGELALIRTISGYRSSEAKHVDEDRAVTRTGPKKAAPVSITKEQAAALRTQPDTPQGRRDALLMALFLDLGLRCGEVAILMVASVDVTEGLLNVYRPKVNKTQRHALASTALRVVQAYMGQDALANGPLLRQSSKSGRLGDAGMTERAITGRVRELGERVGISGLSAHDLRHYWATRAARNGTPLDRLQDAGGWNSPAMPMRYIESAKVANDGVQLD